MKLTPLDIKRQEFNKSLRGYDPVEVDAFLDMLADELEQLLRDQKQFKDEASELRIQLHGYQEVEATLKDTLVNAQESIKESRENSNREAELMIHDAELRAEKIVENAKLRLAEMKNELVVVKAQKDSFARRLRHLLESQLELIEVLGLDDLGFEQYDEKESKPAKEKPISVFRQEKIEFEGIEDVLGDEPSPQDEQADQVQAVGDAAQDDDPHSIDWGMRERTEMPAKDASSDEDESQSRMSDRLIL